MSPQKSVVWRGFDRVERAVGKPLEDLVGSPRYVNVMVVGKKVQRLMGGAARRVVGGSVGKVLRLADMPTRTDVQRLSQHVTTLTSEVRSLTANNTDAAPPGRQ